MSLNDSRNFRMLYYKQLGLHNVEQKKALDQLLKEDPINIEKLKIFSEQFVLPAMLRPFVWKLLLGILPLHQDSMEFIKKQRLGQYDDLKQALITMRLIPGHLKDENPCETIKLMYLLENGMLSVVHQNFLFNDGYKLSILESMSVVISEIISDPCDAYWITKYMFKNQENFVGLFAKLPKYVKYYLQLEDKRLFEHLCEIQFFKILRYDKWFQTYFTSVFCESLESLEKIWDKLVAGYCNILVFVFVSILLTFSIRLKEIKSPDKALELISILSENFGRVVVDKTMELWDQHRKSLSVELGCH